MATTSSFCISSLVVYATRRYDPRPEPSLWVKFSGSFCQLKRSKQGHLNQRARRRTVRIMAVTESSGKPKQTDGKIPSWARPDSDEPPPWAVEETKAGSSFQSFELPFYVYLLASAVTAIAAIGSIFEYVNQRPVFGVISPDNVVYAPLLGFFVFTGVPTSAFLWFKSVQAANKEAEEQDRRDGFL
ncbi:hypothetical protein EJ110_NYTH48940 [Nymphaea thermarum]|nr:hypothetical protein EJ110_NYTH48940 [Nymphaea thermarum]